ncbi:hypothetical protein [Streptomyces sp. NPDC048172]|uniref:hypothetical protein n=1 Tax=Streptomyces sp. NPDC048172 TaxID=3365505 RepID=UPI0037174EAC
MKFRNAAVKAVAAGVAALTMLGVGASPSVAGTSESIKDKRASMTFYHKGDKFKITDKKKDGWHMSASMWWTKGKKEYFDSYDLGDYKHSVTKNYNIKEGTKVYFRFTLWKNGKTYGTSVHTARA